MMCPPFPRSVATGSAQKARPGSNCPDRSAPFRSFTAVANLPVQQKAMKVRANVRSAISAVVKGRSAHGLETDRLDFTQPDRGLRKMLDDLSAAGAPLLVVVGSRDEAFLGDRYAEVIDSHGRVELVPDTNHNGVLTDPRAIAVVTEWITTLGAS